jgi:hypothetical protein
VPEYRPRIAAIRNIVYTTAKHLNDDGLTPRRFLWSASFWTSLDQNFPSDGLVDDVAVSIVQHSGEAPLNRSRYGTPTIYPIYKGARIITIKIALKNLDPDGLLILAG